MPQPLINIYAPSSNCIDLIKSFEGLSLQAYQGKEDRPGIITIGYGSIMYPTGEKPKLGDTITEQQATDILAWEVRTKATAVNGLIKDLPTTQSMFDALLSFAYNLGMSALTSSTLLKKMRANVYDKTIYDFAMDNKTGYGVPDSCELLRWCRSNGVIQPGLVRRRTCEAWLYRTGELKFFE